MKELYDAEVTGPLSHGSQTGMTPGLYPPTTRGLDKEETVQQEEDKKNDSNHLSPSEKKVKKTDPEHAHPPYSPYLAAIITDFSSELNDSTHVVSNVTQTLRIWAESALTEQAFTELLYEAKRTTRQYQGRQGLGTINNKMAYFFVVLRRLVASRNERPDK